MNLGVLLEDGSTINMQFCFSIVNNTNAPFKTICSQPQYSIRCNPSDGPIFGGAGGVQDVHISNNSNTTYSGCNFGDSYKYKNYGRRALAGGSQLGVLKLN